MSDHEAERRAFWDLIMNRHAYTNNASKLADECLAQRDKRFPPPAKEAAPEQEELVPCPLCGKQPVYRKGLDDYCCSGNSQGIAHDIHTARSLPEPEARAAWNSMGRKP